MGPTQPRRRLERAQVGPSRPTAVQGIAEKPGGETCLGRRSLSDGGNGSPVDVGGSGSLAIEPRSAVDERAVVGGGGGQGEPGGLL